MAKQKGVVGKRGLGSNLPCRGVNPCLRDCMCIRGGENLDGQSTTIFLGWTTDGTG